MSRKNETETETGLAQTIEISGRIYSKVEIMNQRLLAFEARLDRINQSLGVIEQPSLKAIYNDN